jgi:hypothetical protein
MELILSVPAKAVGLGIPEDQPGNLPKGPSMAQVWTSILAGMDPNGGEFVWEVGVLCRGSLRSSSEVKQTHYENRLMSNTYQMRPEISDKEYLLESVQGVGSRVVSPSSMVVWFQGGA